ncbi:MAG: hypothetical protein U0572_03305 [Phycisphaerales bacterium]
MTVSYETFVPSLTATWNVSCVFDARSGAVKLGLFPCASLSVTFGPPTCVHV